MHVHDVHEVRSSDSDAVMFGLSAGMLMILFAVVAAVIVIRSGGLATVEQRVDGDEQQQPGAIAAGAI